MARSNSWLERLITLDPALLRALLVAFAGILAQVLGYTVVESELIDQIIDFFTAVSALVAVLWARPQIVPMAKVLAYDPNPLDHQMRVLPGGAQSSVGQREEVIEASEKVPSTWAA